MCLRVCSGITVINDTIDRVRTAAVAPVKDSRYFDSASLSSWLVDHKLIESLFGVQSHIELWQRSQSILMFLLLHSRFTEGHLHVVWRALALVRYSDAGLDYSIMEQLIMTIALRLPLTLLHCLWRLMSSDSDSPPAALWSVNVSKLDDKLRDQRRMQLVGKFATVALAAEAKLIKEEAKRTWYAGFIPYKCQLFLIVSDCSGFLHCFSQVWTAVLLGVSAACQRSARSSSAVCLRRSVTAAAANRVCLATHDCIGNNLVDTQSTIVSRHWRARQDCRRVAAADGNSGSQSLMGLQTKQSQDLD
jgi:hypothetical protein